MPPRIKGVVKPLNGFVIAVCGRPGKFEDKKYTRNSFKNIINEFGGRFVETVTKTTTHIVATDASRDSKTVQLALDKREDLILMMPEWLIAIESGKKRLDAKDYTWPQSQTKSAKPNSVAKPKPPAEPKKTPAKPKPPAKSKKTPAEPKKTPAKPERAAAKPKPPAKSKKTPAKSKKTPAEPKKTPAKPKPPAKPRKTPAKPKPAAKSETKAKAKPKRTAAEPKTSVEPLTEYDVWVDDSDLIYDAYLTQTSSVTNRDRVYCIQVMKDPESSTFKTRTKWGGVGKTPMYQVLGNGGYEEAVEIFKEKFKLKSGLDWENRFAVPIPEYYTYDRHYDGDDGATDHS
ncbi:hypothetical protein FOPG_17350 [Fusarium oxysporum f. sp. conglutinans race 2 54008]|uniref:NAD(+) ADP-ribosyltransferase n=1 Tax=Fusarium oxysporum f. sp. conglutinans race 2 54008 TaxID=1089457 RepID=X0HZF6_FUSOX|nr:hypothetical protein FOPG_17350 [Fusarium oxysporum f. sp. conglutinans race 2 54008]KAG6978605.1 Poly [ADP-ribose] polymerase 2 [Fusarium oxysporum f. sp. conglutinans]